MDFQDRGGINWRQKIIFGIGELPVSMVDIWFLNQVSSFLNLQFMANESGCSLLKL